MMTKPQLNLLALRLPRWARLCCIFAATVGLAGNAVAATDDMFPSPVYATLQGTGAVENAATKQVHQGVEGAHYDAVSADGSRLLVSSKDHPEAYLLDARSGEKLATFEIGAVPQGVGISPDGRWGLALSAGDGTVSVIDIKQQKKVKTIAVGKAPHNVRFTADGKLAYVTLQGGDGVAVLDMNKQEKVGEFPVPGIKYPHNLDLTADGKTLWIRGFAGKVAAVDLASHKVLAVIPVGPSHAGIDVIPGGKYVVTGAIGGHQVDVIDPRTFKVVEHIEVGQGPHGVRASRDGRWVYAGVVTTNKIAVIDTRTLSVVKQIPVAGKAPFWIAVVGND